MDLVVYDDDEKRYVPWAVALTAALLVALLAAALTFVLARQASGDEGEQPIGGVSAPEPATVPSATPSAAAPGTESPAPAATTPAAPTSAPTATPSSAPVATASPAAACVAALLRADTVLERASAVDEALARHTEIVDELLAERISPQEAVDRALPVLTDGATERGQFEDAASAYGQAREACPS